MNNEELISGLRTVSALPNLMGPAAGWCKHALSAIETLTRERDEAREALNSLAYCQTDKGPMLWKDIWQNEVDTIEHLRRVIIKDLKSALHQIVDRSENGDLGTSKVVDMRNIAAAALAGGKQE